VAYLLRLDRLYNTEMVPLQEAVSSRGLSDTRSVVAFVLNLIAAIFGPAFLGAQQAAWLIYVHLPWMPLVERQLLVNIVFAALAAFLVSRFWSAKITAKWVWIVPLILLLVRMAMYALGPTHGSVMQNLGSSSHYGFWRHFFSPDPSKSYPGYDQYGDFLIFTVGTFRAATYSLVIWALARREKSGLHNLVVEPASDASRPTGPAIWARPKVPWLSATNLLIGINIVVFAAMVASGMSLISLFFSGASRIQDWGGNFGWLTLRGEPWRLVTHSFLHWNIFHLATNMICLWWVGRMAERVCGPFVLVGIYLLTSIGPAFLRATWAPLGTSAGASGSILGIAGFVIAVVFIGKLKLPANQLFYRRMPVFLLVVVLAALSPGVDNVAHLGGFASGVVLGFFFSKAFRTPSSHKALAAARLFEGREAIERHEYAEAVQHLQIYIETRPNDAEGHALLGHSFHALERFDDAAQEYQLALNLGCPHDVISANLVEIQERGNAPDDAKATSVSGLP
jgi:membrane associated rhomboid family serine protease